MKPDAVTQLDEDIALVEAELEATDQAAEDALARTEAGDTTVTPDDLPRARGLAEFLSARLRGLRTRRAAAADDRRLRGIGEIRREVEAYAAKTGEDLVKAERALLDAAVALRKQLDAHNLVLSGWRSILTKDYGIPAHNSGSPIPAERHGRIAPLGDGILTERQRVNRAEVDQIIGRVIDHAAKVGRGADPASLPSTLANLVTTNRGLPADGRYFLGVNGAILLFGPAGPNENVASGLVREISATEALQLWEEQAA